MDFNKLNTELYQLSAPYRFSKKPDDFDKGYLKISNWINDLCYHYEKKRKSQEIADDIEFKKLIEDYKRKIDALKPCPYKDGLLKAINEV